MNFTKITLAASTALTLSMAGAFADTNEAYLDQGGMNNTAQITQNGGSNNEAGAGAQELKQVGDRNSLQILQSGSANQIGLSTNLDVSTNGLSQSTSGTTSSTKNGMSITQSSDNNVIGSAVQVAGTANSSGNRLTITQGGGGGNTVGSVYQRRSSSVTNLATIMQNGLNNTLARVSQDARTGGSYNPNEIMVTMDGSENGGAAALSGAAATSGARSSTLIQGTDLSTRGNKITLNVSGTENEFGVTQLGTDNTVGTLTLGGSSNEVGVYQDGLSNSLTLGTIDGIGNNIGLAQSGNSNSATLTVDGDYNGGGSAFGSGVAGSLATSEALTAGLMEQTGDNNSITLDVIGSFNVFATRQNSTGGGNSIVGLQDGSYNQVAVLQNGSGSLVNFSQVGSYNNASFNQ